MSEKAIKFINDKPHRLLANDEILQDGDLYKSSMTSRYQRTKYLPHYDYPTTTVGEAGNPYYREVALTYESLKEGTEIKEGDEYEVNKYDWRKTSIEGQSVPSLVNYRRPVYDVPVHSSTPKKNQIKATHTTTYSLENPCCEELSKQLDTGPLRAVEGSIQLRTASFQVITITHCPFCGEPIDT